MCVKIGMPTVWGGKALKRVYPYDNPAPPTLRHTSIQMIIMISFNFI